MLLARSHKAPMLRLVESIRDETLEVILEGGVSGGRLEVPRADGGAVECFVHDAPWPDSPTLIELHGGGFALGDARKLDALCAWARRAFGIGVVSVNYRLAPDDPFPAALGDVRAVLLATLGDPGSVGMGAGPVFVMGYSAGATLAVASALALGDEGREVPAGLLLHYPFFDAATEPAEKGGREIDLPLDLMRAFNEWYVGTADVRDPLISPLYATDAQLARLPRTLMYPVVGDAMYAEAHQLADHMRAAGVDVSVSDVEGAYHGYVEDFANERVYREMNTEEAIAARPAEAAARAREVIVGGLEVLLGTQATEEPDFM